MNNDQKTQAANALALAVSKAGGPTVLAAFLGISTSAVSQWVVCPPARVLDVSECSGVARHDLRPDMYPAQGKREMRRQLDEIEREGDR